MNALTLKVTPAELALIGECCAGLEADLDLTPAEVEGLKSADHEVLLASVKAFFNGDAASLHEVFGLGSFSFGPSIDLEICRAEGVNFEWAEAFFNACDETDFSVKVDFELKGN